MKQVLPYRPMAPEVIQAIDRLQQSDVFDAEAFAVVSQERQRRAPMMLAYMLPAAVLGGAIVWFADSMGWLPGVAPFFYAFFPILFAALGVNALRGRSVMDEMRLGRAIARWEARGGRIRDKPLEKNS